MKSILLIAMLGISFPLRRISSYTLSNMDQLYHIYLRQCNMKFQLCFNPIGSAAHVLSLEGIFGIISDYDLTMRHLAITTGDGERLATTCLLTYIIMIKFK